MSHTNDLTSVDLPIQIQSEMMDQWFSSMIDHLRTDHFMLETNIASREKKEFYQAILENDSDKILTQMRRDSSQFFIKAIVFDYLSELKAANKNPIKLALGLSDSKILVWSEIKDDDEEMEDLLLITEAKINGKYHDKGFYINSTIIEASDKMPIPPHYQTIID